MNILYIALACRPDKGSESRIGWKIPLQSAKKHNVYVITNGGNRSAIEKYTQEHTVDNLHVLYVTLPKAYDRISRGPLAPIRLRALQKKALLKAKELCASQSIDIVHQINPVEFRSIGDYGSIPNTRFVCGPVGGAEYIPQGLRSYAVHKLHIEFLRKVGNALCKIQLKRSGTLKRCDRLMFANRETKTYLVGDDNDYACICEIGIDEAEISTDMPIKSEDRPFTFLIAGRLSYRKGHALALDALKQIPEDLDCICRIIGAGEEAKRLRKLCKKLKLDSRVEFIDRVPFEQMEACYKEADVLLVPSLRETTGSVILEGMARGLPVITSDRFGGGILVEDRVGWRYHIEGKKQTIKNLSTIMSWCIGNRCEVLEKAKNTQDAARQFTWDEKTRCYDSVYRALLSKHETDSDVQSY